MPAALVDAAHSFHLARLKKTGNDNDGNFGWGTRRRTLLTENRLIPWDNQAGLLQRGSIVGAQRQRGQGRVKNPTIVIGDSVDMSSESFVRSGIPLA